MKTDPSSANQANKVVTAFLDGRRVKGCVFNFSAIKESFDLFPSEDGHQAKAAEVRIRDVKAVFFVRDFVGNREYQDAHTAEAFKHGRKIEVTFRDGEKLLGVTDAYNPQKLGFFMFPGDPKSNNLRIFVVIKNAKHIRFV